MERFEPWNYLAHHFNTANWWTLKYPLPYFEPLPYFKSILEEIKYIKSGIGKLILNCQRENDRIGVYYDVICPYMGLIKNKGNYSSVLNNMMRVLENNHLQYDVISSADLKDGVLLKKQFDLLMFPLVLGLSDDEIKEIRKFVSLGGKVIADEMPGILNEYGNERPSSPLEDLFSGSSGKIVAANWTDSIRPKPEVITELRKRLKELGVAPLVGIEPFLEDIEVVRFTSGQDEYILFLPMIDIEPIKVAVKFHRRAYIYDIRKGKYLGKTDNILVTFYPGRAEVFSLLKAKIRRLTARVNVITKRQGWDVSLNLRIRGGVSGIHVVRLTVKDPSGKEKPELARNLKVENGRLKTVIFLPQSEKAGNWTFDMKDVASGIKKRITLKVPSR